MSDTLNVSGNSAVAAISNMTEGKPKISSIPNWKNEPTDDKELFRVVDRQGDWQYYHHTGVMRYLPAVNHILGIGFPKGAGLLNWIKRMSEEEANKALASAGERGAKVHAAIRELISGMSVVYGTSTYKNDDDSFSPLSADEWDYLLCWVAWAENFKPHVLKHETAVWNKKYFYAGTVDFIGTITLPKGAKIYIDDKLTTISEDTAVSVLLDWKSGNGIYDDYKLQTAAYAACLKTKPKTTFYTGVVRIGTKHQNGGYEMKLWSRLQTIKHFKQFLQTKNTYHFVTGGKDWQPEISQIPTLLNVKVPKIEGKKPKPNVQPRKKQ